LAGKRDGAVLSRRRHGHLKMKIILAVSGCSVVKGRMIKVNGDRMSDLKVYE